MIRTLALMSLVLFVAAPVLGASSCGEPVPAPHYQGGEKWTWRNEKGVEYQNEVTGFDGELTKIRWSNGDVGFYDPDRVLRKVVRANGEVLTTQGAGSYTSIGQRYFDFPLSPGKTWRYSYYGQPAGGGSGLLTYFQDFRVRACEDVSTPAGRFAAVKIEVEQSILGSARSGIYHVWYAPEVKNVVKQQYRWSQWWGGGRFLDSELVKFEAK